MCEALPPTLFDLPSLKPFAFLGPCCGESPNLGSKVHPKSTKLEPKIFQVGSRNHSKSVPRGLVRSWEALGPSWLQVGEEGITYSKSIQNPSSWKPKSIKLEAKILKNLSQEASWEVLGSSWPMVAPSWGVLGPSCLQVGGS